MAGTDLSKLTISELAPKIKAREVSPIEVTEAALAQTERLQPVVNGFITVLHEQAMTQAREEEAAISRGDYRGPLHGIPIGIKDNIATAGIRTTLGSKVLSDNVPEEDAHTVALCKEAGAIILGKENLEEFAAGPTSNNQHYGAVHNPWNLDHVPGGSSGGGGANVAACVTYASLGTDLGGSRARSWELLRRGGTKADLWTGEPARPPGDQFQRRPHRPFDPLGHRLRPGPPGHRRLRPSRPKHRAGPGTG